MTNAPGDTALIEGATNTDQLWRDEMNFCEYPLSVLGSRAPEGLTSLDYEVTATAGPSSGTKRRLTIVPPGDEQLQAIVRSACPFLFADEEEHKQGAGRGRRRTSKQRATAKNTAEEARLAKKRQSLLASIRGVPTANDDDVVLALIELTRRKTGFKGDEGRTVPYSLYELGQLLGWSDSSRSYQRLVVSLLRWKAVTLTYCNAWRDNEQKTYLVSKTFNILADVTIYWGGVPSRHRGASQGTLPFSSFTWDETVYKSFRDGYLKNLNYSKYSSLRSMIAKRMYRFLDKHFALQEKYLGRDPVVSFDLCDFAHGHIGLGGDYEPWKIKQKIAGSIRELEKQRVIDPLPQNKRYIKQRHGKWDVVFRKWSEKLPVNDSNDSPAVADSSADERDAITQALDKLGVSRKVAESLVRDYPASYLTEKMEHLAFLIETGDSPDKPVGWLVDAIRGEWKAPSGFKTSEERARQQQAAEENRRREMEKRREQRRQEEQEIATRKAERAHIDSVLKRLALDERNDLEAQALSNADEEMRASAQQVGGLGNVIRRMLVDREVLRQHPLPTDSQSPLA